MIHLSQDEGWRTALGNNGRDYIVNNLSRGKTARTYLEVLEGLNASGRRQSKSSESVPEVSPLD